MIHMRTMFNHFMKNLKEFIVLRLEESLFLLDVRREVHENHLDRSQVHEENLHCMELIEVQSEGNSFR